MARNNSMTYYITEDIKTNVIVCCTPNRERAFSQAKEHKKKTGRDCIIKATNNNYEKGM